MRRSSLVPLTVALALMAACSPDETDFSDAAETAIEGELAESLGLGEIEADCDDPPSTDDGTTFTCTAETEGGEAIDIEAEIQGDDEVVVNAINVISASDVANLEAEAARVLAEQVGQDLPAENVDCGGETLVIQLGEPIVCGLTDPASGEVFDATIVFEDVADGSFTVEVGSTPRA
jgi:Domain of unknown function (DUF4333)